ncbi:hypothetical protein OESDEN_23321 [Oesophagostomum dentatum]|uniref:Uncharacterized protein n=1 Tax=Oesophagostomum dentatum TaxID=61180 RepID=A0A0B1RWL4_OESDE|nr:hypothetical protein OESDEN_23321 [Oesophagostomum dentatum]
MLWRRHRHHFGVRCSSLHSGCYLLYKRGRRWISCGCWKSKSLAENLRKRKLAKRGGLHCSQLWCR